MTLAILIASEIVPKNLGARNWRAWGPWVGVCLKWLTIGMTPFVWLIERFTKDGHHVESFSREELKVMADLGHREGELEEDETRILHNLLQLRDTHVRDVMTPRVVVMALPRTMRVGEFMAQHSETPFSRIPVFDKDRDHSDGFVLKDDILLSAARGQLDRELQELSRELPHVYSFMSLKEAFESLLREKQHIAVVRDEFGGMEGLVTMEDIVETLLGAEIVDEADTKEDMQVWARSLWEKRAERMGIRLDEVESYLER